MAVHKNDPTGGMKPSEPKNLPEVSQPQGLPHPEHKDDKPGSKLENPTEKDTDPLKGEANQSHSSGTTEEKDRELLSDKSERALRDPTLGPAPVSPHIPSVPKPVLPNPNQPPSSGQVATYKSRRVELFNLINQIAAHVGESNIPVNSPYWEYMNEVRFINSIIGNAQ